MLVTISQLERNAVDDTVVTAHWVATVTESHTVAAHTVAAYTDSSGLDFPSEDVPEEVVVDYTASSYGTSSFTRNDASPTFIAFNALTEADVVSWLSLDEGLEAGLQAQIDLQKVPVSVTGTPW